MLLPRRPIRTQAWLERAINTAKMHTDECENNPKWLISDTAACVQRSAGAICQDLLIVSWLKTHEDQIRRFSTMKDCLEFIRIMKRKQKLDVSHVD